MATPAPQNLAPDAPEQQVSPTHPLQMSKVLVAYGWTRLRQGELGVMPALAGLALIWAYFEIKQETFLSARNLSNLVLQISVTGTLASRGFVSRRRDPSDRRVVVVDLEPAGRVLVERLFPAHSERVTALFENLDESEKRTFSELCRKLAA